MSSSLHALILGDIVGQSGCRACFIGLKQLIHTRKVDIVVANGENAADGFGLTAKIADQLFSLGIHVITTGNHIWQQQEILKVMDEDERILRPANYPGNPAGRGYCIVNVKGYSVGVVNLQGRVRLTTIDCPFQVGTSLVRTLRDRTDVILVDFHAEDAEEKEAIGRHLDGSVAAVVGTHTHVQTADERILRGGTAYMSDIGMTGPTDTVIGFDAEVAVRRMLTQLPIKMEVSSNPSVLKGVHIEIDPESGRAVAIERISYDPGL